LKISIFHVFAFALLCTRVVQNKLAKVFHAHIIDAFFFVAVDWKDGTISVALALAGHH
jgi:hypothetical protein